MICYKVSSPMEEKKKKKAEQDEVYTLQEKRMWLQL